MEPQITPKISFAQFRRDALMHKFGQTGFVLLYDKMTYGWKYRIMLRGSRTDCAFRAAYYLLFGVTDVYDERAVEVSNTEDERTLKMPLSADFTFAYLSDPFTKESFSKLMGEKKKPKRVSIYNPELRITITGSGTGEQIAEALRIAAQGIQDRVHLTRMAEKGVCTWEDKTLITTISEENGSI